MKSIRSVAGAVGVVVCVGACAVGGGAAGGGGGGGVDVARFPTRAAVAAIAARPAPPPTTRGVSLVNDWTFVGPFDGTFTDAPLVELSAFEQPVARAHGAARFTVAGRCVARELAQFLVKRGENPDDRFRAQVQARCGSVAPPGMLASSTMTNLAGTDDATLQAAAAKAAVEAVSSDWSGDLGIGFARVGDKAVVTVVSMPVAARLAPTSRVAVDGHVDFSGTVVEAGDAESIWGYVNQGDTGVQRCERREGALPRFSFSCPVDVGDAVAGFEILVQRRGRLLGDSVATGLFTTATAPGTTWQATTWGADTPLPDDDDALAAAVLQRTNGIRIGAGLPPLIDEPKQGATVAKLAPHYFGAADAGLHDQIALGAMAGWDLTSPVRDGHFSSLHLSGARLHELMGALLDSPSSRSTLLDVAVGPAAIGAVRNGNDNGLLLTTWVPYQAMSATDVQRTVFEALKSERRRRGHTNGLGEVGMEDAVAAASGRLQAGDDPERVMSTLLRQTVDTMQRSFQGWTVITTDPDHIAWPEELLTSKMTYVAVAAGTRLKAGNPWATTAVLIVAFVDKGTVAELTTLPAR